jgi:hypothetical protein
MAKLSHAGAPMVCLFSCKPAANFVLYFLRNWILYVLMCFNIKYTLFYLFIVYFKDPHISFVYTTNKESGRDLDGLRNAWTRDTQIRSYSATRLTATFI